MRHDDDFIFGAFGEPFPSPGGPNFEGLGVGGPEAGLGVPVLRESAKVDPVKFFHPLERLSRAARVRGR